MRVIAFATAAASATSLISKQVPDDMKNVGEDRMTNSFGESTLTPPCSSVTCNMPECQAPFEKKEDGTCCGYCWAPDHVVGLDRHKATKSMYEADLCDGAPSSCRGPGGDAQCFSPSCDEGYEAHCVPGACCATCEYKGF
mmetsp:Transcript_57481/g.123520  ORF Transcript_57481/g.123520 Transcript_57481/m.123520 type:complete len:140 (-) Transcript_57481:72-491(-)